MNFYSLETHGPAVFWTKNKPRGIKVYAVVEIVPSLFFYARLTNGKTFKTSETRRYILEERDLTPYVLTQLLLVLILSLEKKTEIT